MTTAATRTCLACGGNVIRTEWIDEVEEKCAQCGRQAGFRPDPSVQVELPARAVPRPIEPSEPIDGFLARLRSSYRSLDRPKAVSPPAPPVRKAVAPQRVRPARPKPARKTRRRTVQARPAEATELEQRSSWTPERDQVMRDRYDARVRGRKEELALELGVSANAIQRRAKALGLTHRKEPHWTPDEDLRLKQLIEAGFPHGRIARELGRSEAATKIRRQRLRLPAPRSYRITMLRAARMMGVDGKAVGKWIDKGALPAAARARSGRGMERSVTWPALLAFVTDPKRAHFVDVAKIRHPGLRAAAEAVARPVFMTPGDVARELQCDFRRVGGLIRSGRLPAVRNGNWMIDRAVFNRLKPSLAVRRRGYSHEELERAIGLREEGWSWREIITEIGHGSPEGLRYRYDLCFDRRPKWRAVQFAVRELGGTTAIVEVVDLMRRRGHRVTYEGVRGIAHSRPGIFVLTGGAIRAKRSAGAPVIASRAKVAS